MILLNHEMIIGRLSEISSERQQVELWLSDGSNGKWSCLTEAYLGLFDDSALAQKLETEGTVFGSEIDSVLTRLDQMLVEIDDDRPEEEKIIDLKMADARDLATTVLERIMAAGSMNAGRISDRLLEWRDMEMQRKLWLPAADGEMPESKPYDAAWHLLRGKDYWGYLDLGKRRRDFSRMFDELEQLIFGHVRVEFRPPEHVISDPAMRPVRQLAARIMKRLEEV